MVCHEDGAQYYPTYDAYPAWREIPKGMSYCFGPQFPSYANNSLYWWDMDNKKIVRKLKTEQQLGNLLAINENWAWDLFRHPKLIDLRTGKIEWREESIHSGEQNSSIIGNLELPSIALNRQTGKLAIGGENRVEVLSFHTG